MKFYHKGRLTTNYSTVDEVRVTFGKTKTTSGREVRSHFATQHSCCVVKALSARFKPKFKARGQVTRMRLRLHGRKARISVVKACGTLTWWS